MKNTIRELWMPLSGAGASISAKKITEISVHPDVIDVTQIYLRHDPMWHYLVIGVLGAAGGLLFKIAWSALKRRFPKLQKLDNEKVQ